MTFYNIIFGILFLGACRQTFLLVDTPMFWTAACVAILIFNDALNTSDAIEGGCKIDYPMEMKLLDLAGFVLLFIALVALEPGDNPFDVVPSEQTQHFLTRWSAWPFMLAYWLVALVWNWRAGVHGGRLRFVPYLLTIPFAVGAVWATLGTPPDALAKITLTALLLYFLAKAIPQLTDETR